MPNNFEQFLQGAIGGGASGFGFGGPAGAAIGAVGGGILGMLNDRGANVDEVLPPLNANTLAQQVFDEMPPVSADLSRVATQAQQGALLTERDLIAAGLDPVDAARISTSRALDERKAGTESVLENRQRMQAQLVSQLLPYQIQRDEDRQSYMNLQRDQPGVLESFAPLVFAGLLDRYGNGGYGNNGGAV